MDIEEERSSTTASRKRRHAVRQLWDQKRLHRRGDLDGLFFEL
jgi:hypothetical protein